MQSITIWCALVTLVIMVAQAAVPHSRRDWIDQDNWEGSRRRGSSRRLMDDFDFRGRGRGRGRSHFGGFDERRPVDDRFSQGSWDDRRGWNRFTEPNRQPEWGRPQFGRPEWSSGGGSSSAVGVATGVSTSSGGGSSSAVGVATGVSSSSGGGSSSAVGVATGVSTSSGGGSSSAVSLATGVGLSSGGFGGAPGRFGGMTQSSNSHSRITQVETQSSQQNAFF